MKKNIKMKFSKTILDLSILDLIKEEAKKYKVNRHYDNEYDLIIYFSNRDITDDCLDKFDFCYWRPWHDTYGFLEKLELALRLNVSKIEEYIEDCYFHIGRIFVESNDQMEHTEIQLVKTGLYDYENKRKRTIKIHLDIHLSNDRHIFKVVDPIGFQEYEFYIDERNNNKNFYNLLLFKKEQGEKLDIDTLSEQDWKQLVLKEKVTTRELVDLYEVLESVVVKNRKKFIQSVKQYDDEYFFYYLMFHNMSMSDYYSNFCIPILEYMKSQKIDVIYEYLNLNYHELFHIEEELRHQKEIERNNLAGREYVMPLSGILLKKLYWAAKNHQLDRKFLKNNWFNTYYGSRFLQNFIEQIEKSNILDLYESGKIYEHSSFEDYNKKWNLKDSEKSANQTLMKVPFLESKEHIKKKRVRTICTARDYVNLAKIKSEVGRTGEELVYNYEMEALKEYPELQRKIEKTYLINDGAGYDIESYDYNGNIIYIEVKANKSDGSKRIKFYISNIEDEFISSHKNAYIYYVYDLKNPKLRVIDQKTYLGYSKKAIDYEVDQEIVLP